MPLDFTIVLNITDNFVLIYKFIIFQAYKYDNIMYLFDYIIFLVYNYQWKYSTKYIY